MRIALPAVIAPEAFYARDPAAALVDLGGETMGTMWSVRLAAPSGFDAAATRAAIAARLDGIVAEMSQWEPHSLLSRFNGLAAGEWADLPGDFAHVVARGLAIAEASGGSFDPTLGRLAALRGFGSGLADPGDRAEARAAAGWQRLAFDPEARRVQQPGGLWLDFSGIAKGHAVDTIADLLEARGIRNCLVEIGGELVGRGIRPDAEPWWVDLESPPGVALEPLRIALHDLAVATSGDYRRGPHTLDPRTGRATTNGVVSVSVIHETALAADAWATALTVLGPEAGMALAEGEGLAARIVTDREHISSALAAMLAD
jgi:FAD:protein FMN transferase